jgi:hypothetical protein
MVWWNVRDVEITQDWFKAKLDEVGLNGERYAREHNYRSTFIRCLRQMEEQRIIRKVTEDGMRLVYQFTAETLIDDDPDNPRLDYTPETTIEIDKDAYWTLDDFAASIVKCDEAIKPILVEKFEKERTTYHSSDLTRYIQKIFKDHADIVSLRAQGSVYFVPATYQNLVSQVAQVLAAIPQGIAHLEHFPIPNVAEARDTIGRGVESEVADVFSRMQAETEKMQAGTDEITDKWVQHRQKKITAIKERLLMYEEVLGDAAARLRGKFDLLSKVIVTRKLEL